MSRRAPEENFTVTEIDPYTQIFEYYSSDCLDVFSQEQNIIVMQQ